MNKRKMATTAGILTLIGGITQLFCALIVNGYILIVSSTELGGSDASGHRLLIMMVTAPLVVTGILAILGSIYIFKRKSFGIGLSGAILAFSPGLVSLLMLGIYTEFRHIYILTPTIILAATPIILTILSRKELADFQTGNRLMPKISGVLIIILVLLQLTWFTLEIYDTVDNYARLRTFIGESAKSIFSSLASSYLYMLIASIPFLVYAIFGSIYAFMVKRWLLTFTCTVSSLIGCILFPVLEIFMNGHISSFYSFSSVFTSFISITAIILVVFSKPQFSKQQAV